MVKGTTNGTAAMPHLVLWQTIQGLLVCKAGPLHLMAVLSWNFGKAWTQHKVFQRFPGPRIL